MDHSPSHETPAGATRRRSLIVVPMVLAVALGLGAAWAWKRPAGHRAEAPSVYRNARPGVKFVGDGACARCHAEIARTFAQHSMGRSLMPIEAASADARGGPEPRDLFDAGRFLYSVQRRDGKTYHKETRRDAEGRVLAEIEGEVKYVLGSGNRALSFLIDRDGFLFESPITWYGQKRTWALSPGFVDKPNDRFERPITAGCLFCHANRVEHVAGSLNHYRPPVFHGHAIGCERCHGPGELHARQPFASAGDGPNIVNPRDLEPALREDVCQQCHLSGEDSVERLGHALADYRPGLPLRRFEAVFVRPPGADRDHHNANHVEQMHESRCFRESRGELGCISCHDPHELPAPERKVDFYRDRCLTCHADRGCSLPPETRKAKGREDNCIACHMPRASTTDIPHVATTVHSIPRHRDGEDRPETASQPARKPPAIGEPSLVPFHRDQMSAEERSGMGRDLGVALSTKGPNGAREALPLLETALAAHPEDVAAQEARGYALKALGRGDEGLAAFESALGLEPGRESTLVAASTLADNLGRREASLGYWRRAIAVDPWRADYYAGMARQLALGLRWHEAAEACRRALRLNPASLQARVVLVRCILRTGSPYLARVQFDSLLEFDPPDREGLIRWFQSLR